MKFQLVLNVTVDLDGEDPEAIVHSLEFLAYEAMGNGRVTGSGPATISRYKYTASIIKEKKKKKK